MGALCPHVCSLLRTVVQMKTLCPPRLQPFMCTKYVVSLTFSTCDNRRSRTCEAQLTSVDCDKSAKNSEGTINSILVLYGAQTPKVILLFTPAIHRYYQRVSLLPIYEKKAWLALVATNSSHHNLRTGVILSYGMCTQSGCSRSCFVLICAELTRG